jgi:hypothetical protein
MSLGRKWSRSRKFYHTFLTALVELNRSSLYTVSIILEKKEVFILGESGESRV